jgi:hypothetical protein
MSWTQDFIASWLPRRWSAALEAESRRWVMTCPCGHQTSLWEMGGIRFKAVGRPWRLGRCARCGRKFWGRLHKLEAPPAGG